MAAEKRKSFALKRVNEAVACFSHGEWRTGLAKAQAALELLEGVKGMQPEDTGIVCGGVCLALAACNRVGEALRFFADHAIEIADESIKETLLSSWLSDANSPMPGDVVQFSTAGGSQMVGAVLRPAMTQSAGTCWTVRVQSTAQEASAAPGVGEAIMNPPVPDGPDCTGLEIDVWESEMTLLSLRLSNEQRKHWQELRQDRPGLFGERMRSDNEARWQRLFGAAARSSRSANGVGMGATQAAEDLGLPLEQSFVATLHGFIDDYLALGDGNAESLTVDVLGCRPALELDDQERVLTALLDVLPSTLQRLTVRMCGPEVGCSATSSTHQVDSRTLSLEVRPGLYHDAIPEGDADLVVAMNAGIGVPQYAALWGPTLDLLVCRPKRVLFALTSYTAGELLREERMLRHRWGETLRPAANWPPELLEAARLWRPGNRDSQSTTLSQTIQVLCGASGQEVTLHRGDVVMPLWPVATPAGDCSLSGDDNTPTSLRILRSEDFVYVGPNRTPGRSRNFGALVLWVGGRRCGPVLHDATLGASAALAA